MKLSVAKVAGKWGTSLSSVLRRRPFFLISSRCFPLAAEVERLIIPRF